ncbi:MAG: EamA family transporter, partial [Bacteroidota bacterium]|nr:EamA family transporter [Bacteroidota bacterium]
AIPFPTWAAIAYLIFIGSIVAFIAFIYTIKHLPPAIASLYAYINPMITILVGAWLLHEPISFNLLIGAVITITGVYLVNFSMKRSK